MPNETRLVSYQKLNQFWFLVVVDSNNDEHWSVVRECPESYYEYDEVWEVYTNLFYTDFKLNGKRKLFRSHRDYRRFVRTAGKRVYGEDKEKPTKVRSNVGY